MHSVRKQILEILKQTGGANVAELAERLDMAPVSVRHHLDILQGDNLIRVGRLERNGTVGRPQQCYVLTAEAAAYFPNNFSALAAGLVREMKQILPPEQVRCVFQAMAREIAQELNPDGLQELPIEERLDRVTEFLNQHGYLARWEVDPNVPDGAYLLHKYNCPYSGVSGEHRELCMMDQTLIDELLGRECQRVRSVAEHANCCTYQIADGAASRQEIVLFA